jgi:hypothetical protein
MSKLLCFVHTAAEARESLPRNYLEKRLGERLGGFYLAEIAESREDISRLGQAIKGQWMLS